MVSDDLNGKPGHKSPNGPGLYFGGNVQCPESAWKAYVDTPDSEFSQHTDIDGIKITCYREKIPLVSSDDLWGYPSPVRIAFPGLG